MYIVVTTANKNPATNHHWWRENVCLQLQLRYFSYFWFIWISAETRSHAKHMNSSRARAYRHQPRIYVYHYYTSMIIKYLHMCLFIPVWCKELMRFKMQILIDVCRCRDRVTDIVFPQMTPGLLQQQITQNSHDSWYRRFLRRVPQQLILMNVTINVFVVLKSS